MRDLHPNGREKDDIDRACGELRERQDQHPDRQSSTGPSAKYEIGRPDEVHRRQNRQRRMQDAQPQQEIGPARKILVKALG